MPSFSTRGMLAFVAGAGLVYAVWYQSHWKGQERLRAQACCANQNLIDRYVMFWEARHGWLDPTAVVSLDFDVSGTVVKSHGRGGPATGSRAVAELALDAEAFRCPEASALRGGVHYRWLAAEAPMSALGGRMRGAMCLLHGDKGPGDDPASRHAW